MKCPSTNVETCRQNLSKTIRKLCLGTILMTTIPCLTKSRWATRKFAPKCPGKKRQKASQHLAMAIHQFFLVMTTALAKTSKNVNIWQWPYTNCSWEQFFDDNHPVPHKKLLGNQKIRTKAPRQKTAKSVKKRQKTSISGNGHAQIVPRNNFLMTTIPCLTKSRWATRKLAPKRRGKKRQKASKNVKKR